MAAKRRPLAIYDASEQQGPELDDVEMISDSISLLRDENEKLRRLADALVAQTENMRHSARG